MTRTLAGPVRGPRATAWGQRLRSNRIARFVMFVVKRVLGTPIAEGRLINNGWPGGLGGIVAVSGCCYTALIIATGGAIWLRGHGSMLYSPPGLTIPLNALPAVLAGVAMSLACLLTAALHATWWVRLSVLVVIESLVLNQVSWSDPHPQTISKWVVAFLLAVFVVVRRHGRFHWLEFVVAMVLTGAATTVQTTWSQVSGPVRSVDMVVNNLLLFLVPMWSMATPLALLGGAAMVELTSATSVWMVTGAWRAIASTGHRASLARLGVGLLLLARSAQLGYAVATDTSGVYRAAPLALGAVEFGLVVVAAWLIQYRAVRRPEVTWRPDPDDITTRWSAVSLWIAIIVAVPMRGPLFVQSILSGLAVPSVITDPIGDFSGGWRTYARAMASILVMFVLAWVWSGRGRRRAPVIMTCVGGVMLCAILNSVLHPDVSAPGLVLGATVAAIVVGSWLLTTRRMTTESGVALTVVLLLTTAYHYRDIIDEPLTTLFAVSGVSAGLVVGLIWRLFTDNGWARADSARFPRATRVLVALASSLFAVTTVATVALSGGKFPLSISSMESLGDQFLGRGLVVAVCASALMVAVSGRRVRDVPYGPRDPLVRPRRAATPGAPGRVEPDESARRSRSGQPG